MNFEVQSNLSEAEKVALVDFLLELTDERNRFAKAPFDHPEVIVPIDGRAPDNTGGRSGLLALAATNPPMFMDVKAVGATGRPATLVAGDALNTGPEPAFLNVKGRGPGLSGQPIARVSGAAANVGSPQCNPTAPVPTMSHYCH
jgi:hypothetical protein